MPLSSGWARGLDRRLNDTLPSLQLVAKVGDHSGNADQTGPAAENVVWACNPQRPCGGETGRVTRLEACRRRVISDFQGNRSPQQLPWKSEMTSHLFAGVYICGVWGPWILHLHARTALHRASKTRNSHIFVFILSSSSRICALLRGPARMCEATSDVFIFRRLRAQPALMPQSFLRFPCSNIFFLATLHATQH
jgi:hypothetical protein